MMATLWVLDKVFGNTLRRAAPRLFVPAEGNSELMISAASSFFWNRYWITWDFRLALLSAVAGPIILMSDTESASDLSVAAGALVVLSSRAIPFIAAFRVYKRYAAGSLKIINFSKK